MFLEIADRADWRCVSRTALSSSLLARLVCFSLCKLSCRTQLPPGEEAEHKPAGTKIDVYLAASFSITVITITSSLPGTSRMLSLSESDKTIR